MRSTTFTPEQFNDLVAAIERLAPNPDIGGTEVLATLVRLLAAGWKINWPHDVPSTQENP
jgi:hypothetical protein